MKPSFWQQEPPADSQRERRKQAIRLRIIEAAIRLFEARGFEATTLEEICEQAAVSRPTFYTYFGTKQDLINALAEKLWLNVATQVTEQSLARQDSVSSHIRAFFSATRREITRYGHLERELVRHSMNRDAGTDSRNSTMLKAMTAMFLSVYAEGRKSGQIGDRYPLDFLAETTMGCIAAVMMNWAFDAEYPVEKRLKQTADLILTLLELQK